uniref:Uncharacterized protein n=1 Tax=viral metagenome TaxID=1070528 RepID=A0A6M3IQI9_9ZZZZ
MYGDPVLHGHFLDQMVVCECGWCGVETEILNDTAAEAYKPPPKQLELFGNRVAEDL